MLKILRKYNTIILAFGGVVLMIAFVLPQLPQMFGGGAFSQTVAQMGDENINAREYDRLSREFRVAAVAAGPIMQQLPLGEDDALRLDVTDHWIMLRELAIRNGLVGGIRDGEIAMEDFEDQLTASAALRFSFFDEETLRDQARRTLDAGFQSARRTGFTDDQIYEALAVLRGIARLTNTMTVNPSLSTQEAYDSFQDAADRATVSVRWFRTQPNPSDLAELSETDLESFFEANKDQYATDSEIGVGYLRPDAVRGEFIRVNRVAATALVPVDELTLSRYWSRDKERFGEDYTLVRDAVETAYRTERADELMDAAAAAVLSQRELELREFPVLDRYRDIPAEFVAAREPIESYALAAAGAFDLTVDPEAAESLVRTTEDGGDYLNRVELGNVPGLGSSSYRVNERLSVPFADVALGILELGQSEDYAAQSGVMFGPLEDTAGNMYFVRFTSVRPESPPESWLEMETRVRRDLARVNQYEAMLDAEDELTAALKAQGFGVSVPRSFVPSEDLTNVTVTPDTVRLEGGGGFMPISHESFRTAVIDFIEVWDPAVDAVDYAEADRVLFVPVPESLGVAIVEIVGRVAPSVQDFRSSFGLVRRNATIDALEALDGELPISPASLADELGYKKADRG